MAGARSEEHIGKESGSEVMKDNYAISIKLIVSH